MSEVYLDDDGDLVLTLTETIDAAKSNMLKAALQAIFGLFVIAFIVLLDHPTLGIQNSFGLSREFASELWVLKYVFIFSATFYVLVAVSYIFRSYSHINEARFLYKSLRS